MADIKSGEIKPKGRGGRRPGAGRPKGAANKITEDIRAVLRTAAAIAGDHLAASGEIEATHENGDTVRGELAYLVNMALREPRAFAPVWAKGVPVAVEGSLAGNITIQVVTGVPRDPVDGEPSPT